MLCKNKTIRVNRRKKNNAAVKGVKKMPIAEGLRSLSKTERGILRRKRMAKLRKKLSNMIHIINPTTPKKRRVA